LDQFNALPQRGLGLVLWFFRNLLVIFHWLV
jgi:hypothetical protein